MYCKQKKGMNLPKCRTCPSQFSQCPSPMVPIPFGSDCGAPCGTHNASTSPLIPALADHNTSNASGQQCKGFHSTNQMHCKQKQEINPPKRRTCPSRVSECPSPMVPIPFAVTAAPPGVHIMPSLHLELPISRSQHFKCQRSAVQRFSLYKLDALQAKKGHKPPKASKLSLTLLGAPVPNGPNSFCSGCGALWDTHNALTST